MKHVQSNTPRGGPSTDSTNNNAKSCSLQINESLPLNLRRRGRLDGGVVRAKLLNCKQYNKIAILNVRSLRNLNKQEEIALNCRKHSISILGVVDHKIVHDDDEIRYSRIGERHFITSSAWRNSNNAAMGGIGLVIDNAAESNLADVVKWNSRILIAYFTGNPKLTVIVHYSPVEGSNLSEEHYKNLNDAVKSIPKHNVLLLMGDFNAHLDANTIKFSYHAHANSNGKYMRDFMLENDLVAANGNFQKKRGKLWTYMSEMSGTKTQIDYILVNKKWKNSIHNCEAYNTFASVGSDHRIVAAKVKLSLRKKTTPPSKNSFDWSSLKENDLNEVYTVAVKNRFSALSTIGDNTTERYSKLVKAVEESANELVPKKVKSRKKRISTDPKVVSVRSQLEKATVQYFNEPSDQNREQVQELKEKLKESYNHLHEMELQYLIRKVETSNDEHRHKESWKLINEITGRKLTKSGIIKAKNKQDRVNKWFLHFKNLLGNEPQVDEEQTFEVRPVLQRMEIPDGVFTIEEYTEVKKAIQCGKACGPDGIPPEVLKFCDLDNIMLGFMNQLFFSEKPAQWSEINLKPLPKSGNLCLTDNYRGIALSSIAAKMANRLILNRIRPKIDPLLRPNQNGFRPGRSTTSHILALRRIIEGVKEFNLQAVLIFVDFKKAFDSIHRTRMFEILKAYDIPERLIKAIGLMYADTRAKVITPDGETQFFDIVAGVLQGDTLAPFLFAIVLDYVMRQALVGKEHLGLHLDKKRSRRHQPTVITDTDFADDIALIAEDIANAQKLLTSLECEAEKVGLHLNAKKTEMMKYNIEDAQNILAKNGAVIAEVKNFKYLGGWMASSKKDFEVRKALAWSGCNKLTKIWQSKISRKIKERLFIATVEAILLYGCESWAIDKTFEKQLNGCYTRMLRTAFNVSWKEKLCNKQLYGNLPRVSDKVTRRRLMLAGHCVRHPDQEIAGNLVLWEPKHGYRNRGRRNVNYIDTLLKDTGLATANELKASMLDRDGWKERVDMLRVDARQR